LRSSNSNRQQTAVPSQPSEHGSVGRVERSGR
jgi:hypothetical protein